MQEVKKWGIRVNDSGWIIDNKRQPAVYYKKADAVKDAKDFNHGLKEKIYTVKEYKK
jgi:hypothetical protein